MVTIADAVELAGVAQVDGDLVIKGSMLENLDVFGCLELLDGSLKIVDNPALSDISGLSKLTKIDGGLVIESNPSLPDLHGLEAIRLLEDVRLAHNDDLQSLAGLETLGVIVGNLEVLGNPRLEQLDLTRLTNVVTTNRKPIGGDVRIEENESIESLKGLGELRHIDVLHIESNPSITTLQGLGSLVELDALELYGNRALTSLEGFEGLSEALKLDCRGNDSLVDLSGLEGVVINEITLRNNDQLSSLDGLRPDYGLTALVVQNNPLLASLQSLETVEGVFLLQIDENASLDDLRGLEGLRRVAGMHDPPLDWPLFTITDNPKLHAVDTLHDIETIGAEAVIRGNVQLPNCEAQAMVDAWEVHGPVRIEDNLEDGWPDCP